MVNNLETVETNVKDHFHTDAKIDHSHLKLFHVFSNINLNGKISTPTTSSNLNVGKYQTQFLKCYFLILTCSWKRLSSKKDFLDTYLKFLNLFDTSHVGHNFPCNKLHVGCWDVRWMPQIFKKEKKLKNTNGILKNTFRL